MTIKLHQIPIRDVVEGYVNSDEDGVVGWGGKLNIRPKYQREFVYRDKQRDEVIKTVLRGFPLNVMYWAKTEDGFEVMDGQQRTISICEYVSGGFSVDGMAFHNRPLDIRERIRDYPLMVYQCEGTDSEKLDWFKIVNIAGERLEDQELLNALYTGTWLTDAKRHFSKTGCVASLLAGDYMKGEPIRQKYLETVLRWINNEDVRGYMSKHQHDANAAELWQYLQTVIGWVKIVFPNYRREMKGLEWGAFYNRYHANAYNSQNLERRVAELMQDEDVTSKSGIYEYLLGGDERHLNIRAFPPSMRRAAFERQKGKCPLCGKTFTLEEMDADHITPWSQCGKTAADNCQMLCRDCNRRKGGK